jgi:Domain of unknown function (DUF4623)
MRRTTIVLSLLTCACAFVITTWASAATITMAPLTTWSPNSDGWLAPGEGGYTFLGTGNNERGLAYGNGHVYLVSRSGGTFVRRLDPATGADLGSLDMTSVSGGTFAVSAAAIGGDGAIYVANLTTQSTTSPFKVYKWATEASSPTVAYTGDAGLAGSRAGDDLASVGTGSGTRLVAGYNSTPAVAGNNGYSIIDPTAGTASAVGFTGTPPNAGDFRLGITFVDSSHVLGTAGSSLYRNTSFSGSSGTLINSPAIPDPAGATADRLLQYTTINGVPLLAVQSIGDSHVSVYDVSDPSVPIYLVSGNNTSGSLTTNGNGTGQIAWGDVVDNGNGTFSRTLYAMSTNQGIQAFNVTLVPEPASIGLLALVFGVLWSIRFDRRFLC